MMMSGRVSGCATILSGLELDVTMVSGMIPAKKQNSKIAGHLRTLLAGFIEFVGFAGYMGACWSVGESGACWPGVEAVKGADGRAGSAEGGGKTTGTPSDV